jgi:membrane associated rhomboid family serine protease
MFITHKPRDSVRVIRSADDDAVPAPLVRRADFVSVGTLAAMFAGGGVPYAATRGRGRRGGGADPWFLVMAYQLWQQIERLGPNKPRVTLACMALAAALHFNLLGDIGDALLGASSADACVSAQRVLSRREWWRLLASPLRFADDVHLVVNLTSFLHKGNVLERARGPEGFARLLLILLLATNLAYVAVAHLAHRLGLFDVRRVCLTGCSALNFALRSAADAAIPATGNTRVWGITVPTRWASWAELVIVYLLNPHLAGLVYHACGIVVGAAYAAAEKRTTFGAGGEGHRGAFGGGFGGRSGARAADGGGGGGIGGRGDRGGANGGDFDATAGRATRGSLRDRFFRRGGASSSADLPSGTRVVLSGLRATDMNGKWATAEGPDANAPGRVLVRLDDGAEFSVLPEKCIRVRSDVE